MNDTPRTYREVASEAGLEDTTADRYVEYMYARWSETEGQKTSDGYAMEWALRFKRGVEYAASDMTGKYVLREIDRKTRELSDG